MSPAARRGILGRGATRTLRVEDSELLDSGLSLGSSRFSIDPEGRQPDDGIPNCVIKVPEHVKSWMSSQSRQVDSELTHIGQPDVAATT